MTTKNEQAVLDAEDTRDAALEEIENVHSSFDALVQSRATDGHQKSELKKFQRTILYIKYKMECWGDLSS